MKDNQSKNSSVDISDISTDELWSGVNEILREISKRDQVTYKVSVTPESVQRRIKKSLKN